MFNIVGGLLFFMYIPRKSNTILNAMYPGLRQVVALLQLKYQFYVLLLGERRKWASLK